MKRNIRDVFNTLFLSNNQERSNMIIEKIKHDIWTKIAHVNQIQKLIVLCTLQISSSLMSQIPFSNSLELTFITKDFSDVFIS